MSPSLLALKQWVYSNLSYISDHPDYHQLANSTMRATSLMSLPAYNPHLPEEAALRCSVMALSRYLCNDKFPGWGEMGKYNFCQMVKERDVKSVSILLLALKSACEKNKNFDTGSRGNNRGTAAMTTAVIEHHSRQDDPSSRDDHHDHTYDHDHDHGHHHLHNPHHEHSSQPPKPSAAFRAKPHPYIGDGEEVAKKNTKHEGSVLREFHKASGKFVLPSKNPKKPKRSTGVTWSQESHISRPSLPIGSSGAMESFDQHMHPPSPRPVHGRTKEGYLTTGGMQDPDYIVNVPEQASPNHRNSRAPGYKASIEKSKAMYFNDDAGVFGPSKKHFHGFRVKNGVLYEGGVEDDEEFDDSRKKDVYGWILGLGVRVKPEILGLEGSGEANSGDSDRIIAQGDLGHDHQHDHSHEGGHHVSHEYSGRITANHYHSTSGANKEPPADPMVNKHFKNKRGSGGTVAAIRAAKKGVRGRGIKTIDYSLANPLQNGVFLSSLAAGVIMAKNGPRAARGLKVIEPTKMPNKKPMFLLPGTFLSPKTRAQAMRNVASALQTWIKDEVVDGQSLFKGSHIVEGDGGAVWGLLFCLYDAYKGLGDRKKFARKLKAEEEARDAKAQSLATKLAEGPERGRAVSRTVDKGTIGTRKSRSPSPSRRSKSNNSQGERNSLEDEGTSRTSFTSQRKPSPIRKRSPTRTRIQHPQYPRYLPGEDYQLPPSPTKKEAQSAPKKERETSRKKVGKENDATATFDRADLYKLNKVAAPALPLYEPPTFNDLNSTNIRFKTVPICSKQQHAHVQLWLHGLGMNAYTEEDTSKHKMLTDKFRNGVLLCDVVCLVEPELSKRISLGARVLRITNNVDEARFNICAALDVLRHSHYRITPRLANDPDSILAGDTNVIFGLLWEVGQVYPKTVGFSLTQNQWFKMASRNGWLQYTPLERLVLSKCLVNWMVDLGVMLMLGLHDRSKALEHDIMYPNDYTITRDAKTGRMSEQHFPSLFELRESLFDGSILCAICQTVMTGVRKDGLKGWINAPKTRSVKLKNMSKVVTALKGWVNAERGVSISCRWLFAGVEDQLVDGNWAAMLGLLEDLLRCVDGMMPRKVVQKFVETPYYGKYAAVYQNTYDDLKLIQKECNCEEKKEQGADAVFEQRSMVDAGTASDLMPLLRIGEVKKVYPKEIVPEDSARAGGLGFTRKVVDGKSNDGPSGEGNDLGPNGVGQLDVPPEPKKLPTPRKPKTPVKEEVVEVRPPTPPPVEEEAEEEAMTEQPVESPFPEPTRADVYNLKKWLSSKLRIKLRDSECLYSPPFITEEFKSGMLLARIAEALEPGRTNQIKGLRENPKHKAGRVANCKRAIEALIGQFRPSAAAASLSASLRMSHDYIAAGDAKTIVLLLLRVKKLHSH
ncbi:hypothetical protein TrVE_jg698 [Triparma verrucosa]|uniref:Calponin-homology (CH) domain-containing protein n=1 Tax=Triparma verrucosa TaxID=1606542 RepID=A0A9W7DQ27_9STRA|nr:hypothetical protein TrVE_jg698 [Triparma verrucosa]